MVVTAGTFLNGLIHIGSGRNRPGAWANRGPARLAPRRSRRWPRVGPPEDRTPRDLPVKASISTARWREYSVSAWQSSGAFSFLSPPLLVTRLTVISSTPTTRSVSSSARQSPPVALFNGQVAESARVTARRSEQDRAVSRQGAADLPSARSRHARDLRQWVFDKSPSKFRRIWFMPCRGSKTRCSSGPGTLINFISRLG